MSTDPMSTDPMSTDPMSAATSLTVGRLPRVWTPGETAGTFVYAAGRHPVSATLRVFAALGANPDYLLDRVGAKTTGPLGRPTVQSLPDPLADGVSVVAFEETADGTLLARIELVRRAWDVDILLTARTAEIDAVDPLFSAMLDLLAVVTPEESAA